MNIVQIWVAVEQAIFNNINIWDKSGLLIIICINLNLDIVYFKPILFIEIYLFHLNMTYKYKEEWGTAFNFLGLCKSRWGLEIPPPPPHTHTHLSSTNVIF